MITRNILVGLLLFIAVELRNISNTVRSIHTEIAKIVKIP